MKKKISVLLIIVAIIAVLANCAYAANEDVTLSKVKDNVCEINLDNSGKVIKKLNSVENSTKTVTLQIDVENTKKEEETIEPSEIFFVLDNSKSMEVNKLTVGTETITRKEAVFNAAKTLAETILTEQPSTKIGLVRFSTNTETSKVGTLEDASLIIEPTSDISSIKTSIDSITTAGDQTDIDAGIQVALNNFSKEENLNKYIILLTDGVPNVAVGGPTYQYSGEVATKTKATLQTIKEKGMNLITVMTGVNSTYQPDPDGRLCPDAQGKTFLDLATEIFGDQTNPNYGKFYYVSDENVVNTITRTVYSDVTKKITNELTNIHLEDYFPANIIENYDVAVTNASATSTQVQMSQPVVDVQNRKITWDIAKLPAGEKATLIYTLVLKENFNKNILNVETPTNEKVDVDYTNPQGEKKTNTSSVSPSIILQKEVIPADNTTADKNIPNAGDNLSVVFIAIITIGLTLCIGIAKYRKNM